MALTQMQIIQSLGEAMNWFEREINWGVPPTELRHLCGRIGELYAALMTNGQMATSVNQKGYDVVAKNGDYVSVKTTAVMSPSMRVAFNPSTLSLVQRVIVLRINVDEMQIETLLDLPIEEAQRSMKPIDGKLCLTYAQLVQGNRPERPVKQLRSATFDGYEVRELETGTIEVARDGVLIEPALPILRQLAEPLQVSVLNANGNKRNTRQLGSAIIRALRTTDDLSSEALTHDDDGPIDNQNWPS